MAEPPADPITQLLERAGRGEPRAAEALLPLVYEHLRELARRRMAGERAGHTLQATALVHEAYVRIVGDRPAGWAGRGQFFAAAAEAMRRILVEHARSRGRLKRGGGGRGEEGERRRVPLGSVIDLAAHGDPDDVLAMDEAVTRLGQQNPDVAAVLRLRFYAGLGVDETAEALGTSPRSVNRAWTYARAWLFRELRG